MSKKDWVGNNKAVYTTLGSSNHALDDREINDFYATDSIAIDKLFEVENFSKNIWECACGLGHLSKRMESLGKNVYSTDLIDRGYGIGEVDFLKCDKIFNGDIITNPPYKFVEDFIYKAMSLIKDGNKVAMFLKLTFLEGQKRKLLFQKYPFKTLYVFSKRVICCKNGDFDKYPSSAIAYGWYVWEKGFKGDPIIKWI